MSRNNPFYSHLCFLINAYNELMRSLGCDFSYPFEGMWLKKCKNSPFVDLEVSFLLYLHFRYPVTPLAHLAIVSDRNYGTVIDAGHRFGRVRSGTWRTLGSSQHKLTQYLTIDQPIFSEQHVVLLHADKVIVCLTIRICEDEMLMFWRPEGCCLVG